MSGLVANYESGEEPSPTAPPQNDEEYDPLAAANDADARLLFPGTGAPSAAAVLQHPHGLDPRFSTGGFSPSDEISAAPL